MKPKPPSPCRLPDILLATLALQGLPLFAAQAAGPVLRFDLGSNRAEVGFTVVTADMEYARERGFGFEPGFPVRAVVREGGGALTGDGITGDGAFFFSVDVPEGNHRVTVTLGDSEGVSETTVKAELRRLMVENVRTEPGESGETYRDSIVRGRRDRVRSLVRPGDYLFLQFGHNDQKQQSAGTGGPFTTYQEEIRQHIDAARERGGVPVLLTPMHRRTFEGARIANSLHEYPEAVRRVAREERVPLIDLHEMSRVLYEALGPEGSIAAFAAPDGRLDNTHHNAFGSHLLAQCVAQGIRDGLPLLARFLADDFRGFDPAAPDPVEMFTVPPSPLVTNVTPLGS